MLLREQLSDGNPLGEAVTKMIVDCLTRENAKSIYEEKIAQVEALLKEMQNGPMRSALFIEMLSASGNQPPMATVMLDDGTEAFTLLPIEEGLKDLRLGDRVALDGKGRFLLRRATAPLNVGELARFERRIDDRHIEVTLRQGSERGVYLATHRLMEGIKSGEVRPGANLVVSVRRSLALSAVPPENGLSHYRFLDRGPVPDVLVERDIGNPPQCIEEVRRHVHLELTQPELRRRYHLRRCCTRLLSGVSGSGKSLAVLAIHRRIYEAMSEVTGVPIEKLPPRAVRVNQAEVLSMWHGQTEQNWQRIMDEVAQLADETFTTPDGRELKLPVLVVLEEIDGMGRVRGQEAIHDRVLTNVLQSLDPARAELSGRLVIFIATTNEPHLVDPAMLRRVGGTIEHFTRLNRGAFAAVLQKLTRGLPAAANNGCSQREIWSHIVQSMVAWFFGPTTSDQGLVELTYAGATAPVVKRRRDFLTGALVDRAVQQAATEASEAEAQGLANPGIMLEQLARAFEAQIRGLVDQLKEHNVGSYTDLPDGARVASLRRIPQPAHLSLEFHHN